MILLHDELINQATWHQLSQYAYQPKKYEGFFDPSQNLECLSTGSVSNLQARYLVVQFSYFLQPHNKSREDVIPKN